MIYIECDRHEVLVKSLLTGKDEIKHDAGKSRVCALLKNSHNCKGIIDEDPDSLPEPYLKNLHETTINGTPNPGQTNIRVFRDTQRNNILLLLCPTLQAWVLSACAEQGIDIRDFNLPNTVSGLHDSLTFRRKHNMGDFQRLLMALLQSNSPKVKMLSALLNE